MTSYKFTADQRADFRKAITSHPSWDFYRQMKGLSASGLNVDEMLKAAAELQPPIDPSLYGTAKIFMPHGQPKPKPYDSGVSNNLFMRFNAVKRHLSYKTELKASEIFQTVFQKQEGRMTEGQHRILCTFIQEAESRAMAQGETPAPAPYIPAPETPKEDSPMPTAPAPHPVPTPDAQQALQILLEAIGGKQGGGLSESQIIELIHTHAKKPAHVTVDLRTHATTKTTEGVLMHYKTPFLLSAMGAGVNVMLVGASGSGKTTACGLAAKALGLDFYFTGAIDSAYKLSGFVDAQGRIVSTAFRKAYQDGGAFLFDELDGSFPSAVLAFNAALANDSADFPDGLIKKHPDFRAIAACNTYGRGANREYVGRMQLDAASLDRFVTIAWDYDTALESAIIGAPKPDDAPAPASIFPVTDSNQIQALTDSWFKYVLKVRAKAEENKVRIVVSPRATFNGAKLLAAGWAWDDVQESALFKGIDSDTRAKIAA
jgi:MoxR-like ATPase